MAAREDYSRQGAKVQYVDVSRDAAALRKMLELNGGRREVPTVVEGGRATVGYGGT